MLHIMVNQMVDYIGDVDENVNEDIILNENRIVIVDFGKGGTGRKPYKAAKLQSGKVTNPATERTASANMGNNGRTFASK